MLMANLTQGAQKEAKALHDLLWTLHKDLDDVTIGDLRREIDKAVSNAQYVMDELGAIDETLDEHHFDEQQAEQQAHEDHLADMADAAGY
jgi:hypothetical protein